MLPHHPRRQKTLPVQPAAAAAVLVGMTLNEALRGTYHAGPNRLQDVGSRVVRPRRVVLGLDSRGTFLTPKSANGKYTLGRPLSRDIFSPAACLCPQKRTTKFHKKRTYEGIFQLN